MTLFLRFLNLSVSYNPLSKSKNHEICAIRVFLFFWSVRVYVWPDKASSFSKNRTLDLLTLPTTFYDVSVSCNRFLKTGKAPIWRIGNRRLKNFNKHYASPTFRNLNWKNFHNILYSLWYTARQIDTWIGLPSNIKS